MPTPTIPLERLRQIAARLGPLLGARLVVLFGSAAREEVGAEDLDIGILPARNLDMVDATNRLIQAIGVQAVDLVDLRRADPVLLMAVARDGQPLHEATPGEWGRFCSLAVRRFADTRKFREAERQGIRDFAAGR